ncbi:MAG: type II toxin-antitoxin system RelE/ParE family toxin [Mesorhizobium sp.]|nr:type II toxin-antitoxin system RelE/ParE family toxin [Mesorhizobium sp.]
MKPKAAVAIDMANLIRYISPMKRIVAAFYANASGRQPVRDWLIAMSSADRKIVGKDIATVEFGWPVGMPVCRALGSDLREIRSTIRGGKVEVRTYFAIDGGTMLLLHAQEGKSGQADAIKLALHRLRDHRNRQGKDIERG